MDVEEVRQRIRVVPFPKVAPLLPDLVLLQEYDHPDPDITVFRLHVDASIQWDVEDALADFFPSIQYMNITLPHFFSISGNDRVYFALMQRLEDGG